ncbi:MAG: DUF3375 domain-containing protein, partial [Candidatus Obscuribacterales bacterium]|nr:DUF3375 domain-containing protein [Candidatus Obscuribacterales bacterium]
KPLWSLLAARNAPIILALLQAHLLDNDRRVPQSILYERIERDLEELRGEGVDVPQRAQAYVADWLSDGYLERYFPVGAVEEEYEISAAASQAIRFVESNIDRRATATESRLSAVIHQLARLIEETDKNQSSRISSLLNERERIESEIARVESGDIHVLEEQQALERIREVITLTQDLVADFRRVRDEFDILNRSLREKLLEETDSRGDVLEALFAGVDLIGESDAGRTFAAFWRLLTDPQQNQVLEDALESLDEREFFRKLTLDERNYLRRMTRILLEQGGVVHDVLQNFARSLKTFVQSREYLEQRRINQLLNEAQRAALALKDVVGLAEKLEYELPLTSCRIRSLSQMALHDPSLGLSDATIADAPPADISLEAIAELVEQSEIDFRTLKNNIRACLTDPDVHQVSIGEVMGSHPAHQGLGSVIGYLSLGTRHGIVVPEQKEEVCWKGADAEERSARIPMIFFKRTAVNNLG